MKNYLFKIIQKKNIAIITILLNCCMGGYSCSAEINPEVAENRMVLTDHIQQTPWYNPFYFNIRTNADNTIVTSSNIKNTWKGSVALTTGLGVLLSCKAPHSFCYGVPLMTLGGTILLGTAETPFFLKMMFGIGFIGASYLQTLGNIISLPLLLSFIGVDTSANSNNDTKISLTMASYAASFTASLLRSTMSSNDRSFFIDGYLDTVSSFYSYCWRLLSTEVVG